MAKSWQILVVDDEAKVRFILGTALRTMDTDMEVVTARNGREALTKIADGRFDLMITDIQMPGVRGVELTRKARSQTPDTRVLWVTAHGTHRVRDEGNRLGVSQCLEKPLGIGEIRSAALAALEARDAGQ